MLTSEIGLLPYPDGKTFAFTIVDDTDMATLESVRPIYDFLFSLGLKTTKTVWVQSLESVPARAADRGDTLERAEYAAYIRLMRQRGFEIALHNVRSQSTPRPEIVAGIERFKELLGEYPRINVHHEKNRENLYFGFAQAGGPRPAPFRTLVFRALYRLLDGTRARTVWGNQGCSGEDPESPYFWGDVCRNKIPYVRSNVFFRDLNTLKSNPLIPYASRETPYVNYWFDSSNGQDVRCFNSILSGRHIARLKCERGCSILYTHFGMGFVHVNGSRLELNPETRERLHTISGDGDGWYAPAGEVLDRLLAFQRVTVFPLPGGAVFTNRNPFDLRAVTIQGVPHRTYHDLNNGSLTCDQRGIMVLPTLTGGQSVALVRGDAAADARRWYESHGHDLYLDFREAAEKVRARFHQYA